MGRRYNKFIKIGDAINCIDESVNLIGVIVAVGVPMLSKGTDYYITIRIIDESYPDPGLSVTFFQLTLQDLPLVISPGDILWASRIMMRKHEEKVVGCYHKEYSSFALYEGRGSKDFMHYQASQHFSPKRLEKERIEDLREWLFHFQPSIGPRHFLREIQEGQLNNLVGKILHKRTVAHGECILYFWDGTNVPTIKVQTRLDDERDDPLRLQIELEPLSKDVLCTFPRIGTVLRVTCDAGMYLDSSFLRVGQMVHFSKIRCDVKDSFWRGVLVSDTKICYVTEDNFHSLSCQRCYADPSSSIYVRVPGCCIPSPSRITEVVPVRAPILSLMDAITYPEVIGKFKCVVRVLAMWPWPAENFTSPGGQYRIRLTLEDPTARIHALLCGSDAEKFFDGLQPGDALRGRINILLGVNEDTLLMGNEYTVRNPPWVLCCLKSICADSNDPWGTRQFRIFDTRLVGV